MDLEWRPNDYAWDPETLVAKPTSSGAEHGTIHKTAKSSSKRRVKNVPKVICQIDSCGMRLDAPYYRKCRVCQNHAKAPAVIIQGQAVRFCQKCARFHDLSEFDLERRSCRLRLAEHNRRRRAMNSDYQARDGDSDPNIYYNAPARNATTDVSSYDTPCESTPSYPSGRTAAATDTEQGYPLSALSADIAASVANIPLDFNIDDLLGPLASCLHTLNQVMPESFDAARHHNLHNQQQQQQQQQQVHIQQSAPQVEIVMGPKQYGSAFHLPQNTIAAPAPVPVAIPQVIPPQIIAPAPVPVHILPEDVAAAFDSDIFSDVDLDLALAGILDPVIDPTLPPPPVYTSPDVVVRMSMKFFSCMPSDLPPSLRVELERSLQTNFSMLEGYVRPGCTHVTVDVRVPADQAARIESTPLEVIIEALSKKLPSDHGLLVQLKHHVAAIKSGKTLGVVDASGPRGPHLAALSRVCVSVDEAASTRVDLYGANIGRPGDLVLCRQHGEHVTVEMLDTHAWNMSVEEEEGEEDVGDNNDDGSDVDDASATGVLDVEYAASSVRSGTSSTSGWDPTQPNIRTRAGCMPATSVRLLGLSCGVAEIEVQAGGVMSTARPLLVLPDAAAAAEVEQLAYRARRAVWLDAFLRDAGVVVAHICSEGAAARLPGDVVETLAARTSAYCMEAGCPALGRLLRRAQNALRRAIGTDDTASALAGMLEGAAKEKVEKSLSNEQGDGSIIPLVDNFKGLSINNTKTNDNSQNAQRGWTTFVPMVAVGAVAVAVAVAAHVFQG